MGRRGDDRNYRRMFAYRNMLTVSQQPVKTGSSQSGTDERGKCNNIGLSAACPSNEATIRSMVVAVA